MGFRDILFGKKDNILMDGKMSDAQRRQNELRMAELETLHGEVMRKPDIEGIESAVRSDLFGRERLAQSAFEDQRRKLREATAQRGLGNSSVGLSALTGLNKAYTEKLADIRGAAPSMIRAEKEAAKKDYFNRLSGAVSLKGLQTPTYMAKPQTRRQGGLFGLATTIGGAAIGGMFGGPAGAGAGAQIGAGIGQAGTAMA